jgi:hypothetical protein
MCRSTSIAISDQPDDFAVRGVRVVLPAWRYPLGIKDAQLLIDRRG